MDEACIEEKAVIAESEKGTPLSNEEIQSLAKDVLKASPKDQQVIVDKVYARSISSLVNLASAVVSMAESSIESNGKDYARFCDQCDAVLASLKDILANENASEEERKEARAGMMKILEMSNEARKDNIKSNNQTKVIAATTIGLSFVTAVGILFNMISKSKKI